MVDQQTMAQDICHTGQRRHTTNATQHGHNFIVSMTGAVCCQSKLIYTKASRTSQEFVLMHSS